MPVDPAFNLALSIDSNIRRADPTTIKNKFLVGYQGWFYCHGDGEPVGPGHHGWIHWFTHPVPNGGTLNTDYWPDTSQYPREELFVAPGFKHKDGSPAHLFSSRNPKTVQRHFHWMAESGVDGVFLQRFIGLCDVANGGNDGNRRIRDEVGDHVQRAAEQEGRVYAIMYDVSGVQPERLQEIIEADWHHLLQEKRVLNSPNYLREDGRPVIAIWGLGFEGRNHTPAQVRALTSFFRNSTPGGAYLMAGTPTNWRTSDSDADSNPEFVDAWLESFDAISPWTVGRYSDQTGADAFAEDRIQGDVRFIGRWALTHGRKVDYVPVVHPGGSGFNLSNGQWPKNGAPREGGRFLWRQIYNARKLGARTMYGAMWDEYDEGTQFLPAITKTAALPKDESHRFTLIACDIDGYDVPPDWYMRIAGYGSSLVKGERHIEDRFPEKELQNWETKYEVRPTLRSLVASGSGSAGMSPQEQSYGNLVSRTLAQATLTDQDEAPPPPYSPSAEGSDTVPSRGPEPPVSTRPGLAQQDSRPPPPVPPRLNSHPPSPTPQLGPGVAPAVPVSTRPTVLPDAPPRSPVSPLEHRPPLTAHHGHAPTSPHHLSPTPPASMQSSYPHHMPPTQPYQYHDPTDPNQYTSQPPMSNFSPLLQPAANAWYTPPSTQPPWPHQSWDNPSPVPFPPSTSPYGGYQSGYGEPQFAFPDPRRSADYGYAMPSILAPQQLNPGPPPPPPPHSYPSHHTLHAPPPPSPQQRRPSSARPPSPQPAKSPSPYYGASPHLPPLSRRRSSSPSRTQGKGAGALMHKLSTVSAAGSKVLSKFTK